MMKIVLLGKNGQVGWELQRALLPLGQLISLDRHNGGDLANPEELTKTIRTIKPDVIVNAAAYTAVDKAEEDIALATIINAEAPALLATECASSGSLLIHYSTDYVFDGSGNTPRLESDVTAPLNCYGRTKLTGEQAIQASGCQHLIFRTSWVYGKSGNNFIKTIMRLAREKEMLSVIDDQIGAPTGADLLADITAHIIRSSVQNSHQSGIYHLTASGETSWYNYACYLVETARELGELLNVKAVNPIPSCDYKTAALRPLNSRMDTSKLSNQYSLHLPHWHVGVARILREILGKNS